LLRLSRTEVSAFLLMAVSLLSPQIPPGTELLMCLTSFECGALDNASHAGSFSGRQTNCRRDFNEEGTFFCDIFTEILFGELHYLCFAVGVRSPLTSVSVLG
jgi:hypothetical protein